MYYYKFVKVLFDKMTYKNKIFVNRNLEIKMKLYLFA
jgi:hypothetical protein